MAASTYLIRPRVARLLDQARTRPLTFVHAAAGFGKSAELAALAERSGGVHLQLGAEDTDPARFAARIAEAAGLPGVARPVGTDEPPGGLLARALGETGAESLVILDGIECICGSPESTRLLAELVEHAPPNLRLVLSGRRLPAEWRDRTGRGGQTHRVTAVDLAFTAGETAAVLGDQPAEVIERCHLLSAGWPAAVCLAERALAGTDQPGEQDLERLDALLRSAWQELADTVVAEQPCPHELSVAAVVGCADPSLLEALGVPVAASEWDELAERGVLMTLGDGPLRVSPVLAAAARAAGDGSGHRALLQAAADWWEEHGRLAEALECHAAGTPDSLHAFLVRCGHRLSDAGLPDQVVAAARRCAPGDPELDAVVADALWRSGDWDAAAAAFERVLDAAGEGGLPASAAWRFGALLYLQGERAQAEAVLAAARADEASGADDAMVSAWLGSALWRNGQTDEAAALAEVALRQARASRDPRALAAAEVTRALVCASRGERLQNARAYRIGLRAAVEAGDAVQLGRIHANLASKALEEGDYRGAVESADRAVQVAERHRPIVALALENKAEALIRLGHLDLARAAAAEAADAYAASGSLHVATPQLLLGEVYRLRGDQVQARLAFERALLAAELAEDAHLQASACAGLAWVVAPDNPARAAEHAGRALQVATELERAAALNAAAWTYLVGGDDARAAEYAELAEAAAQRTDDRAALATALELRGVAAVPHDLSLLRAALAIWTEVGDPIAAARCSLAIAVASGDRRAGAQARQDLADLAAAPDVGVVALSTDEAGDGPSIATLGRFTVVAAGRPVPSGAWQSRKARELLKLLAARGGRPITREAAAEALWPGEPYETAGARLSVLLSRLRAILDPDRSHPPDRYLDANKLSFALRIDRVRVDVLEFLEAATEADRLAGAGRWPEAEAELRRAEQLYVGDFLDEDRDAEWAVDRREQARTAAVTCARMLARGAAQRGDDEDAARWLLRLLERDPYDEDAWLALIAAHVRMRRHGEARHQHVAYTRRMSELDLVVEPLETLADRLP